MVVMLLETVHTVLPMHACYYYLVTNYFQPEVAQKGVWSLNVIPAEAGLIVVVAQSFFARRVYLIGGASKLVSIVAAAFFVAHLATSIVMTVEAFRINTIQDFTDKTKYISFASLVCAALADFLLSGAIIAALRRTQAKNQQNNGASRIEVATLYILNTGLLTGVLHSVAAILSIAWPYRLYWAATGLVALKLYAITLFAVLNSRKLLVSRGIEVFNSDTPLGMNILARANHLAAVEQWNVPRAPEAPPVINIKVAAEVDTDGLSHRESSMVLGYDKKVSPTLPL
ncbi:hypothetical protein C8Q77DRAFT_1102773 [Trametes polyzona]|nr:hypothetical protein C8Q77DRAFT_1102773 [Trametes polyzona]